MYIELSLMVDSQVDANLEEHKAIYTRISEEHS